MTFARLAFFAASLALAAPLFGTPALETTKGLTVVSVFAHSITHRADAHSVIYELDRSFSPKTGVTAEVDTIGDDQGSATLETLFVRHRIGRFVDKKLRFAGYVGVTRAAVSDDATGFSHKTGVTLGAIAELPARSGFTLYGRSGVALLDESLWTLDAGVRYEVRPKWVLTMGYREYVVGNKSLGGFLAGATHDF